MKSILLASTAVFALAGAAAAQGITLGGSANMGVKDTDSDGGTIAHFEVDIDVVAAGETDTGLTFGASIDVDAQTDGAGGANGSVGDPEIFISGAFGTLTMGAVDHAADGIGVGDHGFDGTVNPAGDVEKLRNGSTANITYSFDAAGFNALVSYDIGGNPEGAETRTPRLDEFGNFVGNPGDPIFDGDGNIISDVTGRSSDDADGEGDFGVLIGYTVAGLSLEAAFAKDESADQNAFGLEAAYAFGPVSVAAIYVDRGEDDSGNGENNGFALFASYEAGAVTLSGSFSALDEDGMDDDDDYGVGVSYDLGGGLSLAGAVGSINDDTVFDLGVNMSF